MSLLTSVPIGTKASPVGKHLSTVLDVEAGHVFRVHLDEPGGFTVLGRVLALVHADRLLTRATGDQGE